MSNILRALTEFSSLEGSAAQSSIKKILRTLHWHLNYAANLMLHNWESNFQKNKHVQRKEKACNNFYAFICIRLYLLQV